jgi:hypothetical protein
MHEIVFRPV